MGFWGRLDWGGGSWLGFIGWLGAQWLGPPPVDAGVAWWWLLLLIEMHGEGLLAQFHDGARGNVFGQGVLPLGNVVFQGVEVGFFEGLLEGWVDP